MGAFEVSASGKTHKGKVRSSNEDAVLVAPDLRLYAVLDGMGGARAGEVASSIACEIVHEYVRIKKRHQPDLEPKELITEAIRAANARVFREAKDNRERHGMGTTVVACLFASERKALIAHVGDSRAYLWRDGRMQLVTRDHTVVADLVTKGILSPREAERHPYSNVLSRNLGSKPYVEVDVVELAVSPGDRILLCSDGLSGYASTEAIEQVLGNSDACEGTAEDLLELALRGGGGDNVTALVIDAGNAELPEDTRIIRSSGAVAWWRRRQAYLEAAQARGLCDSPVCSVLSPDEAVEIVAGNLCEAIYHDLEQTTSINVWTFTETLGKGWFDQDGEYGVLRDLLDILRQAAGDVLVDIAAAGEPYATSLDIAVTRALVVAEIAIGGLLAERLGQVEAEVIRLRAQQEVTFPGDMTTLTGDAFLEQPTVPYMPAMRAEPAPPAVIRCLESALPLAADELRRRASRPESLRCLHQVHGIALESACAAETERLARELVSTSNIAEGGVSPLLDAMDRARLAYLCAVQQGELGSDVRVVAMRRAAAVHRQILVRVAALVVEYGQPITEALQAATTKGAELRARLGRGEAHLAEVERRYALRTNRVAGRSSRGRP